MIGKIHHLQNQKILAVCDKEHIGKEFNDEKIYFKVSERFYGNCKITKKDLIELIKEVNSVNLFGNKCVNLIEKQGLIKENNVILIKGIKHAQIYNL